MTTNKTTRGRKPFRAIVGIAHHALRAYVRAYSTRAGDGAVYRYQVPADGKTASIVAPDGTVVVERSIEKWAAEGMAIRRALIGLKAMKERVEKAPLLTAGGGAIRFQLDILDGRALLTRDGAPLSSHDLLAAAAELTLGDTSKSAVAAADPGLSSVADWAAIGRQFEIDFFQILQSAEKYGLSEAAAHERERGYRLGIIRRKQ